MSENISNKKNAEPKNKRKFNVIDFFICVIIVALVGVLIYSFSPWSQIKQIWTSDEVTIDYTVELREVDVSFQDLIKKNNSVIDSVSKGSLGKVTEVKSESSWILDYVEKEDGTREGVRVENPNKVDITVRITAKANYEKGVGYTVNGTRIAVGEEIALRFPKYTCVGYCVNLAANS